MQSQCRLLPGRLPAQRIVFGAQTSRRTYATSEPTPAIKNPLQRRKGGDLGSHLPKHVIPQDSYIPAYPYGDHALFKQANRGLYGDQRIQFGNNVSHKTETKTRRHWTPNILSKSLYSVALKKKIKLRITSRVLKTMDREGGLDEYLLKDSEHRLKELGPLGWALRWTLLQRPEVIDRMRSQAAALGLDQAAIDAQWPTQQMLAHQKVTGHQLVKAVDLVGEENDDFAEEDVVEVGEVEEHKPTSTELGFLTSNEKDFMRRAQVEYNKAVKAVQRYLSRGNVDNEEDGFKLAFVRAQEREEAAISLRENFAKKIDEQFSAADFEATRARLGLPSTVPLERLKTITYNQWRRQQIDKFGSWEAWRDIIDAPKIEEKKAAVGQEAWVSSRKEMYAKVIEEAENASTNADLALGRRIYLQNAIKKAGWAINARTAGGKHAFAAAALEDYRARQATLPSARLGAVSKGSKARKQESGDAWAALVNANNRPTESRVNA